MSLLLVLIGTGILVLNQDILIRTLVVLEVTLFNLAIGSQYLAMFELFVLEVTFKQLPMLVHLLTKAMSLIVDELAMVE